MKKHKIETAVGIFVVIGLIAIGYMTVKLGSVSFFGDNTYKLYASFNSVTGLRPGNQIDMFGIDVGRISRITIDQENHRALVELRIKNGINIYDDAIASVKTSGLLGDSYLSIDPGGAGELLVDGGVIIDTQSPVDIIELISKYAFGEVKE
ncbi:MAG TPA: outer membrane lipid asymmetry maintenance protein MlaD [Deltaproteobacteria bacterium]|nr:outer membrane lipid asymmetry maintenance protein MlaD [Deltaproteobacteria bacterium]